MDEDLFYLANLSYDGGVVPEAELEQTEAGAVPVSPGWFVLNARDARWVHTPGLARGLALTGVEEHEAETLFPTLGMSIRVMNPGEPSTTYHWETEQEDFLVLFGEAILIIEGQEGRLQQWDFVHCPPETRHAFAGAGTGRSPDLRPLTPRGRELCRAEPGPASKPTSTPPKHRSRPPTPTGSKELADRISRTERESRRSTPLSPMKTRSGPTRRSPEPRTTPGDQSCAASEISRMSGRSRRSAVIDFHHQPPTCASPAKGGAAQAGQPSRQSTRNRHRAGRHPSLRCGPDPRADRVARCGRGDQPTRTSRHVTKSDRDNTLGWEPWH